MNRNFPCGIVEGFYGPAWNHLDRLYMIEFLAQIGMNTYIYAPKDDPYHRSEWRKSYPDNQRDRVRELIDASRRFGVNFVFTVSPGLSIVYSSGDELRILLEKLISVIEIGCRWVGIFLDDIDTELKHEDDRKKFPTQARAHAELLNSVRDELNSSMPETRVIFCPTYYANYYLGRRAAENPYLLEIGEAVHKDIDIMWTGSFVVSPTITLKDVTEFERVIKRKPFLWDNYPVNDYYRPELRIHLGPFKGRSRQLLDHLSGYVSNPMNESEASKVSLLTLADYLKNPHAYSPEKSFRRALKRLFREDYDTMKLLARASKASMLDPVEAEDLTKLVDKATASYGGRRWIIYSSKLKRRLQQYAGVKDLLGQRIRNEKLLEELGPVLDKLGSLAKLAMNSIDLAQQISAGRTSEAGRLAHKLSVDAENVRVDRTQVLGEIRFGGMLKDFIETLKARLSEKKAEKALAKWPVDGRESPARRLFDWAIRLVK